MVHKNFLDRVQAFLLESTTAHWQPASVAAPSTPSRCCQILDIPEQQGVSKNRRGYVLALFSDIVRPLHRLAPMARQNISWVGRITHHNSDGVVPHFWGSFDRIKDCLRVEVHPRDFTEAVCRQLQVEASSLIPEWTEPINDPFEGPIPMTKSLQRCSHRLTYIRVSETDFYWGILSKKEDSSIMHLPLNHDATNEIVVDIFDEKTLGDRKPNVDARIPLSRAYYKLYQVWHEILKGEKERLQIDPVYHDGIGIDLGASPGGWTQVMVHEIGLRKVIAADRARVAQRITDLPEVTYVKANLEDTSALAGRGPFSFLVCDASIPFGRVMESIGKLTKDASFQLPCVWVITAKMPFKTLGSIERQIDNIYREVPSQVSQMANDMFPAKTIDVHFALVHLMANSESERTMLMTFEETAGSTS